ncbi:hypothetical protein [Chitinophaga polysaccharea]|uniref:hypothetical protein n=1 Tax=Chitinophaga polysaccharea TaxID=1293035 RepID=UPI00115A9AD1|nr:hypothetical protein [Chitinophaga polysaccharea]
MIVEEAIKKLKNQLFALDIANTYKCCLEKGKRIRITFRDLPTNYVAKYEIVLEENLVFYNAPHNFTKLGLCKCRTELCEGNWWWGRGKYIK